MRLPTYCYLEMPCRSIYIPSTRRCTSAFMLATAGVLISTFATAYLQLYYPTSGAGSSGACSGV